MKKINLTSVRKELHELKAAQGIRDSISLVIASPENGRIRAVVHRGKPTSGKHTVEYYDNLDDLTALPGIGENTLLIWDEVED